MLDEQRFYRDFLQYVGHKVEIGLLSSGDIVEGLVVSSMFDSALLETAKGRRVIRFQDISYLMPKQTKS